MSTISIYIQNLYDDFENHLNNNKRILFSGVYGIGKTFFLKEFFKQKSDEYNVFHLFPVNYQVSQNEDIFEFDIISQLIFNLLATHKQEKENKKNILIIDDIDRIDPEHIFRILNVFSAHFDIKNEDKNKFGFDKIIFVCDINNIRTIFSSKYGFKTDFNGYINKFFSSYIYFFENKEETKRTIKEYIKENLYSGIKDDVIPLLESFIDSNAINIRHLKNMENTDFQNIISSFRDRELIRYAFLCFFTKFFDVYFQ